ncbi:MAG: response regulator [Acidimicrobiia bacterium]|nr:response regulator [Acidimicrobiia bacterium]
MSFEGDAELRQLFGEEMAERVERLIEGARAMRSDDLTDDLTSTMFREGHTIKGTARVMGFDDVSRAGQMIETVFQQVQHGDIQPSAGLADAVEYLASAIVAELQDESGTGGSLARAINSFNDALGQGFSSHPSDDPPVTQLFDSDSEPVVEPERGGVVELGGLLGALDTWASEDVVRVNAAEMFRLINTVASLGVHAQGIHRLIVEVAGSGADPAETLRLEEALKSMESTVDAARESAVALASAQLHEVTNTFPQLVNYLSKKTGKEVRFELVGDEESVDRQILAKLADPLRQLIVNAIEHGVETPAGRQEAGKPPTATLLMKASVKEHRLEVVVQDDGAGVDWPTVQRIAERRGLLPEGPSDEGALRSLLFAPGFSTATQPSELVGDGTGLTAVAQAVEELRGSLTFETEPGQGTRITVAVPTSRALQDALLVDAGGHQWGIPETAVVDVINLDPDPGPQIVWNERPIPLVSFARAVGMVDVGTLSQAVVVTGPLGSVALAVKAVSGQQQVAAKELGPLLSGAPHLTGAALLAGGGVVVLVDPARLAERARELPVDDSDRPSVLVVDDSRGAREVVAGALASSGFLASVADGANEAIELLSSNSFDALVVDFSMPGSDGIALVEQVRRQFGTVPVVMLSGVATPEDQIRAQEAGVNAYFDKADFREGVLAATLLSLVARFKEEAA